MKKLLLSAGLLLATVAMQAADFSATLLGGEFFFNIVSEDDATCEFAANPNGPYDIHLTGAWLPNTVNYNGKDYTIIGVGVEAFKDGYVTNGANNSTARQREFWGFPTTVTYVRADAFNGFRSNFPCLLRGNVTEFDVTAMRNNKINAMNYGAQGNGTYKSTEQPQGYTVNSNNDTYTPTSALAVSAGSIIYKEIDGGGKVLVAYPGDHRRTYHHTYQSGVNIYPLDDSSKGLENGGLYNFMITEVNASGFVEIGENAFYGNENVTKVNFDQTLTTIGAHAFENSVLTTLVLPATVTTIGTDAFKNVTTLTSITCNALTPPAVVFEDAVYAAIAENEQITVPEEALAAYQADENWGRFWAAAPPTPTTYTITIDENIEHGEVAVDLNEAEEGETVTVTATPYEGYQLVSISVIPETLELAVEVDENNQFTMPADNVTVTAEFSLIPPPTYTITIADGIQNGTVSADVDEAVEGATVTLTVTPAEGYQLEGITVTAEGIDELIVVDENNQFEMPAANVTVSATFSLIPPPTYTITIADGIQNGTVSADVDEAVEGATVTLTVTPAEGYQLESITVTPETLDLAVIVDANNQFEMPADNVTVSATFAEIPPVVVESVITFSAAVDNATVEVLVAGEPIESGTAVAEGTEVTIVVTPEEGYKVESVTVTTADAAEPEGPAGMPRRANVDVTPGDNNTYTFNMPGEPVSINVETAEDQPVMTGITDLNVTSKGVKYVNVMGQVSDRPFNGVNIVIDGDKTYKVIK